MISFLFFPIHAAVITGLITLSASCYATVVPALRRLLFSPLSVLREAATPLALQANLSTTHDTSLYCGKNVHLPVSQPPHRLLSTPGLLLPSLFRRTLPVIPNWHDLSFLPAQRTRKRQSLPFRVSRFRGPFPWRAPVHHRYVL